MPGSLVFLVNSFLQLSYGAWAQDIPKCMPPRSPPGQEELAAENNHGRSSTFTSRRGGSGRAMGLWRKNFVGHVYKYAAFDIKPTYNHYFLPNVSIYTHEKIYFVGGAVGADL